MKPSKLESTPAVSITSSSTAASSSSAVATSACGLTPLSAVAVTSAPLMKPPPAGGGLLSPVRLWVGNIQPRVSEFDLLRLARPLGAITKFDFLLEPGGRPRGYAFISYASHAEAERARRRLDGAPLAGARLAVRWAHEPALEAVPAAQQAPAAAAAARPAPLTAETQIRAIEAKLLRMSDADQEPTLELSRSSSRTDIGRLPRVRPILSRVNAPAAHRPAPYARRL